MNKDVVLRVFFFIGLILLQVILFSKMSVGGYVPYVYVLFILRFPIKYDKSLFLLSSFLLGLSLDMFFNSGGVHAAACTVIAYVRPAVLRFSFGRNYEYQTIKLTKVSQSARIAYVSILVLIHHLILFTLETFSFKFFIFTLKSVLFSGVYTIFMCLLLVALFKNRKE
ncbi:MAG: rod shape-determining protein MreD [Flavobacteriaceae bacterium]